MSYLVIDGPFSVAVDQQSVNVVRIPPTIPRVAWWLVREYCVNWKNKTHFNSLFMDDDGLTVICHPDKITTIQSLLYHTDEITVSPEKWISLIIDFRGSASELPGIVNYLANALSSESVSILHISTFDSEVFLVQEHDIDRACDILKSIGNLKQYFDVFNRESELNVSPVIKDGFQLKVLPCRLMLTKLNNEFFTLNQCSDILIKLLLYDPRYSYLEKVTRRQELGGNRNSTGSIHRNIGGSVSSHDFNTSNHTITTNLPSAVISSTQSYNHNPNITTFTDKLSTSVHTNVSSSVTMSASAAVTLGRSPSSSIHVNVSFPSFMWGICQSGDELTLLLEESDIHQFPPGALQVSPQLWRVIKLTGRAIEFDETGIVSAMSQVERGIPALNISTALTNCTLVPEELLRATLETLSNKLNLPTDISEDFEYLS